MIGSIIIFGGSKNARKSRAAAHISKLLDKSFTWESLAKNPDVKILEIPNDKKSIGIGDVKEAVRFISEKPFQEKTKFLVINDANTLTREAQNSLLKILEEPPIYASIILLTKTQNDLLDTVNSRCKKVRVGDSNQKIEGGSPTESENSYSRVIKLDFSGRLSWAGEIYKEEREAVIEILEDWLAQARKIMIDSPSAKELDNVKKIMEVKKDLEDTNVGQRLALEALVLNLE